MTLGSGMMQTKLFISPKKQIRRRGGMGGSDVGGKIDNSGGDSDF